ncbi:hypothetical protein SDC9_164587 [bioreactor metagenome]|uniref:Uncharacterized protein n=1 Tax=bioreactor metagenome TaxID=1076179 RepID=A0A645FU06_9ZZZZ
MAMPHKKEASEKKLLGYFQLKYIKNYTIFSVINLVWTNIAPTIKKTDKCPKALIRRFIAY